ncbi:response regulator [Erysipelothrix sp. D19-032]
MPLPEDSFAMILLDVMMPFKDGFEVCKTIRETSNVPIIMITTRGDDYDRIMGLDMGADDYVVKPFVPVKLWLASGQFCAVLDQAIRITKLPMTPCV